MKNNFENIILAICTLCAVALTVILILVGITYIKQAKRNIYDVNNDGKVNSLDLLKVQKYILEQNN